MEAAVVSPIRVYLIIENRLLRESLGRLVRKRADLEVVGQSDYRSRPESLENSCDVLTLDHFDPQQPLPYFSLDAPARNPLKTVLIGMRDDVTNFLQAVRLGISGYLLKDASALDVIGAIRAAFRGEAICPPRLCAALFERMARSARDEQCRTTERRVPLTLRQRQLVNLVAQGLTNKEIARQLNLAECTVRNHIHRIMKQVDVTSRQEAVRVAREYELAPIP